MSIKNLEIRESEMCHINQIDHKWQNRMEFLLYPDDIKWEFAGHDLGDIVIERLAHLLFENPTKSWYSNHPAQTEKFRQSFLEQFEEALSKCTLLDDDFFNKKKNLSLFLTFTPRLQNLSY